MTSDHDPGAPNPGDPNPGAPNSGDPNPGDPEPIDPVEDFWAATALEPWNVGEFWARLSQPAPPPPVIPLLTSGNAGQPLPAVDDALQRQLAARRSGRDFGVAPLSRRSLAHLLAAAGVDDSGRRLFPRAGDFDSVHLYLLARRVEGCGFGTAWRYDHRPHALVPVGAAVEGAISATSQPITEAEFATMCSFGDDDPAAVIVFVIEPSQTIARYGAHGQRFGLQEVGHALQNVLLRMAAEDLTGYPMGGLVDAMVIDALGLTGMHVRIGGGLAVGHRREPTRQRRGFRRTTRR